jgi:methyltransferase OMS1
MVISLLTLSRHIVLFFVFSCLFRQNEVTALLVDHNNVTPQWQDGAFPLFRECNVSTRRGLLQYFYLPPLLYMSPSKVCAMSPSEASRQYDSYASSYDKLDGGQASSALGIDQARTDLLQNARGHVLEIGVGTGLNLDRYNGAQISSLTLVDISSGMLQEAKTKADALPNLKGLPISFVQADASSALLFQFGKGSFDTVVDSFSLCVMGVDGGMACLNQLAQVLKPGGQMLLLENSRSSNSFLALYQDATAEMAASFGGKGCVYNQDVRAMITRTRMMDIQCETLYSAGLFRAFNCVRL